MEENESKQEKNLQADLKEQDKIKKAIEVALLNDKNRILLDDGKTTISLEIIKSKTEAEEIYDIQFDDDTSIARAKKTENGIVYDYYNRDLAKKIPSFFNLNRAQIILEEIRKIDQIKDEIEEGTDPNEMDLSEQDKNKALQMEMEQKIKTGEAVQLDSDREISSTENMRMFVQRAWRISSQEIYRVKGDDAHSFKYVAKTGDSKKPYQEIDLSHHREGTNSRQKIWIMEDGKLKEKTVDSMLLKGNYAIATDIPENTLTGNTRTYLAARAPSGRYIAIAAGQKKGVHRNTSSNSIQKDFMSRENTVYDLEDLIESALLAEKIYGFNKDGKLTAKEVEIVRRFKFDNNMDDKEVINIINAISLLREMGYEHNEIKDIIDDVKEAPESKEATLKLAENVEREDKKVKPVKGNSTQGDDEEYVGYGQQRPH